jgi:MFS family permease
MIVGGVGALNIALPSLSASLGATDGQLQWLVVIYQLGFALMLIPSTRLGEAWGVERVLLGGLAGFVLGSLLAAAMSSVTLLILVRFAQGICGALVSPQVLTLIQRLVPYEARGRALMWYGLSAGSGWMVGQLMTGLCLGIDPLGLGWRSAFLIYVPIGTIAFVGLRRVLPTGPPRRACGLDGWSVALFGLTGLLFVYPVIQGRAAGWPPELLVALFLSIPAGTFFIRRQLRLARVGRRGLLDLSLFSIRSFRLGVTLIIINGFLVLPSFLFVTYTVQSGLDRSPLDTAVITSVHTLALLVTALLTSGLAVRNGRRLYVWSALLLGSGFGLMLALLSASRPMSALLLIPCLILQGAGTGIEKAPTMTYAFGHIPAHLAGDASGMVPTLQQLSGAIGVALWGIVYFERLGDSPDSQDYLAALGASTIPVLGLVAIAFAMHYRLPKYPLDHRLSESLTGDAPRT